MSWRDLIVEEEPQGSSWRDLIVTDDAVEPVTEQMWEGHPDAPDNIVEKPERGVADTFAGMLETATALTTGALNGIPGQIYGTLDGVVGAFKSGMTPGTEEFNNNVRGRIDEVQGAVTYQPRTEAGQEMTGAVGGALAPLEVLEPLMPALGLPSAAAARAASRNAVNAVNDVVVDPGMAAIKNDVEQARVFRDDPTPVEIADSPSAPVSQLPDQQPVRPETAPRPKAQQRAAETLVGTGGMPEGQVNMIREANNETARTMKLMLDDARYIEQNPSQLNKVNPRKRIADDVQSRIVGFEKLHKQFGQDVGAAVKENAGRQIPTGEVNFRLADLFEEYKVTPALDADGAPAGADISRSRIRREAQSPANAIMERLEQDLGGQTVNFETLHTLKGWLQDQVSRGSQINDPVGSKQFNSLIDRASGIVNDVLSSNATDSYRIANENFSSTAQFLKTVDGLIDADGPAGTDTNARVALRTRGITNNTQAGINMMSAVDGVSQLLLDNWSKLPEDIQRSLNIETDGAGSMRFANDLETLGVFAANIEKLFPSMRPTSLQGLMKGEKSDANYGRNAMFNAALGNYVAAATNAAKWGDSLRPQSMIDKRIQKQGMNKVEAGMAQRDRMTQMIEELLVR